MNKWTIPLIVGLGAAYIGWTATISATSFGLMEMAVRKTAERGGLNTMAHGNLATPANQPIVRPSPDLAYSTCPFDLSKGPVRVDVVPVEGRYSSLSVFDGRTDVAFVRNDMQAGGKPYSIVLARSGQAVPKDVEVVRLNYDRGIALVRLLLADPSEIGKLDTVRRQSGCHLAT
jgi:uncharacterized membrane protein